MAFNDGIPRTNCFSLTDFHTFDFCPFRFYVTHHLQKKYEIEDGSRSATMGSILDLAIKKFHKARYYGQPAESLLGLIKAASREMYDVASKQKNPSFYSKLTPFINEDLEQEAFEIFKKYYETRDKKIYKSIGEVDFCEWVIEGEENRYKLWGWPDAYELGDDGVVEIVDYKSREDVVRGKENMDMELMPKIYALLSSKFLKEKGYEKARFRVRIWQDPLEESLYEEFDLELLNGVEFLFKQKIEKIMASSEIKFCNKGFCKACNSERKEEFLRALNAQGLSVITAEQFLKDQEEVATL